MGTLYPECAKSGGLGDGRRMMNVALSVQPGLEVQPRHSSDLIVQSVAEWPNPGSLEAPWESTALPVQYLQPLN